MEPRIDVQVERFHRTLVDGWALARSCGRHTWGLRSDATVPCFAKSGARPGRCGPLASRRPGSSMTCKNTRFGVRPLPWSDGPVW